MKALVISAAGHANIEDVPAPEPAPGEVVVNVHRAGICGTDVEFYTGEMAYLRTGNAQYPIRIGHEWMGTVTAVGEGVSPEWIDRRVTGDTMLGCGACRRCARGFQHVCSNRFELGVRGGKPGALAEQVAVPAASLHHLPDSVDDIAGALVEPGGNSFRATQAAEIGPGDNCLVTGPGTIGLLCAMFARASGAEAHLLGRSESSLSFARSLGFTGVWTEDTLPALPWDAVIEASNAPQLPARVLEFVEPGRRVVYVGLAGSPSMIDTRDLAFNDVTAVGILSASPGLAGTIKAFADGSVDPHPLLAATVSLDELPAVLSGARPEGAGPGPKIQAMID